MKLLKLLKEIFLILIGCDNTPVPNPKDQHLYCKEVFFNNSKIGGQIMGVTVKDTTTSISGKFGQPLDAKGNAAQVQDGSIQFSSDNEEVATVAQDGDDPYGFKVTPTGKLGVAQINISADADLGDGVKTITGFTSVEVQAGEAVGFGEPVFDAPVEG